MVGYKIMKRICTRLGKEIAKIHKHPMYYKARTLDIMHPSSFCKDSQVTYTHTHKILLFFMA